MGKSARRFLCRYLAERKGGDDSDGRFFWKVAPALYWGCFEPVDQCTRSEGRYGKGPPHRFRRTNAITYLRSGEDVFTLNVSIETVHNGNRSEYV